MPYCCFKLRKLGESGAVLPMLLVGSAITAAGMLYFATLQKSNAENLTRGRAQEDYLSLISEIKHMIEARVGPGGFGVPQFVGAAPALPQPTQISYDSCKVALGGMPNGVPGVTAGTIPWNGGSGAFVQNNLILFTDQLGTIRFRGWRQMGAIPPAPPAPQLNPVVYGSLLIETIQIRPILLNGGAAVPNEAPNPDYRDNLVGAEPVGNPNLYPNSTQAGPGGFIPYWRRSVIYVTVSYADPRVPGGRRYITNITDNPPGIRAIALAAMPGVPAINPNLVTTFVEDYSLPFRVSIRPFNAPTPYQVEACSGLTATNYSGTWTAAAGNTPPTPFSLPICNPANREILATNPANPLLTANPWIAVRSRCAAPPIQCQCRFDVAAGGAVCQAFGTCLAGCP